MNQLKSKSPLTPFTLSEYKLLPYLLILLVGFLVYLPTLFFKFSYFDDNSLIIDNFPLLKQSSTLIKAFKDDVFFSPQDNAYYRPLLTLSFIWDAFLSGDTPSPFVYHLTNLFIHLGCASLLYYFLSQLKLSKTQSLFFSLIFLVHPVLVQAVAWVPGRNDSLLALFTLMAFASFLRYLHTSQPRWFLASFLSFGMALFTKETVLVLPFLALIYLFLLVRQKPITAKFLCIPASWLVWIILWFFLRRSALEPPIPLSSHQLATSLLQNLPATLVYLGKIFFPFSLSVLPALKDSTLIFGFITLTLLGVAIIFSSRKNLALIIFGSLWFLFFLAPSLTRLVPQSTPEFLEHRLYLPLFGFFLILSQVKIFKKNSLVSRHSLVIIILLLISLTTLNLLHTRHFRTRLTFWQNAVTTSPHHPLAHRNLGAMLYLEGNLDQAEIEYRKTLQLNPAEPAVHNNLGLIYADRNQFPQAESEYFTEIQNNPTYENVYLNLGLLYYKQGQINKAIPLWEKTIQLNPYYISAYRYLAIASYQKGDYQKSSLYLQKLRQLGVLPPPLP